jgi:hypothetical protein
MRSRFPTPVKHNNKKKTEKKNKGRKIKDEAENASSNREY